MPLPVSEMFCVGVKLCRLHCGRNAGLEVFESKVLRRIFGPKRDEVTREWRKLHNEMSNDLYSLPNIVRVIKSRRMKWAGHVAHTGERRGVYRVLVGKPEGKRPLARSRRRWKENIKMDQMLYCPTNALRYIKPLNC